MSNDVATTDDLDETLFKERMAGLSERAIAKRHGVTTKAVREACIKLAPTIDTEARRREAALVAARVDRLFTVFFARALTGDVQSALVAVKLLERQSILWGLDVAPRREAPNITVIQNNVEAPNSTARIRAALDRVIAERRQVVLAGPVATDGTDPPPDAVQH